MAAYEAYKRYSPHMHARKYRFKGKGFNSFIEWWLRFVQEDNAEDTFSEEEYRVEMLQVTKSPDWKALHCYTGMYPSESTPRQQRAARRAGSLVLGPLSLTDSSFSPTDYECSRSATIPSQWVECKTDRVGGNSSRCQLAVNNQDGLISSMNDRTNRPSCKVDKGRGTTVLQRSACTQEEDQYDIALGELLKHV